MNFKHTMVTLFKTMHDISDKQKRVYLTSGSILLFTFLTHIHLSKEYIDEIKRPAQIIYQNFIAQPRIHKFIVPQERIRIIDNTAKKNYILYDSKFIETVMDDPKPFSLAFYTSSNIKVVYPYHVEYMFDDVSIIFEMKYPNQLSQQVLLIVTIIAFFINLSYTSRINIDSSKMKTLKVSVQSYALSQRTTSYLVSIIHHKLNTPLKVLTTKTRMLMQTIDTTPNMDGHRLSKAKSDYMEMHTALKTIMGVTSKLRTYNTLSQNEPNVHTLFTIANETIHILNDDDFIIDIDYQTKLYDIDRDKISSHEIIQIFINQIKFSLAQLADKIGIRIFKADEGSITLLYSDNGNNLDSDFMRTLSTNQTVTALSRSQMESDYFDVLLNFNILNDTSHSKITILSSNMNGNVFEIKLPTSRCDTITAARL